MKPADRYEIEEILDLLGYKINNKSILKRRIIRSIPGFRSGNKVKMTLATIAYLYMLFFYLMTVTSSVTFKKMFNPVSILGLLGATLGLGYFIGSFSKVAYKLNADKGIRKFFLILVYIVIGCVIFYISIENIYT